MDTETDLVHNELIYSFDLRMVWHGVLMANGDVIPPPSPSRGKGEDGTGIPILMAKKQCGFCLAIRGAAQWVKETEL